MSRKIWLYHKLAIYEDDNLITISIKIIQVCESVIKERRNLYKLLLCMPHYSTYIFSLKSTCEVTRLTPILTDTAIVNDGNIQANLGKSVFM